MKIWRYWLTETRPLRCEGASCDPFECNFRVTVGSNALMRIFNADHLYANLCVSQKCYRARLTPKPSRMKMKRYDGSPSWIEEYDSRRQDYAVCRFICAKGIRIDSPAITLHDEKTMCGSGLSLA